MSISLHPNDLQFVVARIPKDIRKMMMSHQIYLGGGFIRETIAGSKPNDIDLFGATTDVLDLAAQVLCGEREGRIVRTENATTVISGTRMPVQFIRRWLFNVPGEVIDSFDFTVCQAVIWHAGGQWFSTIGDDFYRDLAARRLVYTHPQRNEDAGGSLLRVRKFIARGYSIQAYSLAGVVARLVMAVRQDSKHASDEIGLTRVMTGLLREVDPLIIVDGTDVVDEHQQLSEEQVG